MEKSINKKSLIGIFAFCAGAMANNMTLGLIAYVMQTYANVSTTTVALIMTTPSLIGMVYAFFVGTLNKRISSKALLIFNECALFVEGMIFLFLGGSIPIYLMIAAAGLAGFNQGSMNTLLGVQLLAAVPEEKKRNSILGICMATMNVGGVLFTTIGGFMANGGNWQRAYALYFFFVLVVVIDIVCLPNTKGQAAGDDKKKDVGRLPLKVWIIAIHYLFFFLFMYVFGLNASEYIITTYKLGTSIQSGIATSLVTAGGVAAGLLFGLYSKWLKKFTVPFAIGITAIGLFMAMTLTSSLIGIYTCGLIAGFSMSACNPYIMSYLAQIVPAEQYAKALSIYSGFMNVGMFIAVYVIAFLTRMVCGDGTNVHYKFLVGTVGALLCFVTSIPIYVGKDKNLPDAPVNEAKA